MKKTSSSLEVQKTQTCPRIKYENQAPVVHALVYSNCVSLIDLPRIDNENLERCSNDHLEFQVRVQSYGFVPLATGRIFFFPGRFE